MYKRNSYNTSSYKRTAPKPKTYRNGFIKTARSMTVYLQGNKLLLTSFSERGGSLPMYTCKFKVTKNSQVLGTASGTYASDSKILMIKWKSKQFYLTSLK
jgi:hypothetical protein